MREERFIRIGLTRAREGRVSVHSCRDPAEGKVSDQAALKITGERKSNKTLIH